MATYNFSSITTPQAAAYNAATDELAFTNVTGATALNMSVTGQYTLTILSTSVRLTLGPGAQGEVFVLPDGSVLSLPGTSAVNVTGSNRDDHLYGGSGNDVLRGGAGDDLIEAGDGDDTLEGGFRGGDTLSGGSGANTFVFARGDSGTSVAFADVITDWNSASRIQFTGSAMSGGYREELANPVTADSVANQIIAAGAADIVAVQAGGDVIIFADTDNDNRIADDVIVLSGRTLDDISAANFAGLLPPPPPPPGQRTGTAGPDTLEGGTSSDSIAGLAGDDVLVGGDGVDTLAGGDGADSLAGGAGADQIEPGAGADVIVVGAGESPVTAPDRIVGLEAADRFVFAGGTLRVDFLSLTELNFERGLAFANTRIGDGVANFVLMGTNDGVFLFVDSNNDDGVADQAVRIMPSGYTLAAANLVGIAGAEASAGVPPPPASPTGGATVRMQGDVDLVQPGQLIGAFVTNATATQLSIEGQLVNVAVLGTNFTYTSNQLVGGTVNTFYYNVNSTTRNLLSLDVLNASFPAASLGPWVATNAGAEALGTILAGSDVIRGHGPSIGTVLTGADLIRGFGGNDEIMGLGGPDTIFGGLGDDQIYATDRFGQGLAGTGTTYLRGDEGNDYIVGGGGFDDINGNMGNDTAVGGNGDDWVVGGRDNDLLFGLAGGDLVYGNLGNDTCEGGDGNDTIRGGQDDDAVRGGAGNDYISGDRGSDTMTGGAGGDLFHTFGESGIDRVTDFKAGEGDRVLLDPGTQYTVAQVGADVVITMIGGGVMTLVGVQLSSLPQGWIFGN